MSTRESYDAVAESYQTTVASELLDKIFDRAVLGAFHELLLSESPGGVADVGCGPGHLTAYLADLGLEVSGIDFSPRMIAVARATYPDLPFDVQSMTTLELEDSVLAGIVARYSLIHFTDGELSVALTELRRVLRPGGYLLVDFQVGDEQLDLTEAYGHPVSITSYRRTVATIVRAIELTGFAVVGQLTCAPDSRERVPQCHLITRAATP